MIWVEVVLALAVRLRNDPGPLIVEATTSATALIRLHLIPRTEAHAMQCTGRPGVIVSLLLAANITTGHALGVVTVIGAAADCSCRRICERLVFQTLASLWATIKGVDWH